jgi:hypothetical protein
MSTAPIAATRLGRLARRQAEERQAELERCELCAAPIPAEHRHMLDLRERSLMCVCRPCSILFDSDAASDGHYRLIPDRVRRLDGFALDDVAWEELRIPVDIAFFFSDSAAGRVVAFYPSPMGATESLLELEAWERIARDNPVLASMAPDVEALLVNRARGARQQWLVPVSECYGLVGLIRARWRGLTGGTEVWQAVGEFFAELDGKAGGS